MPIRIFIPDAGPLISLTLGESLELLLLSANDVRIVLTDVVEYEATHGQKIFLTPGPFDVLVGACRQDRSDPNDDRNDRT